MKTNDNWIGASLKRVVRHLAAWFAPELLLDREDLMRAAKEIGDKLKLARAEKAEWRSRAMSAEEHLRQIRISVNDNIEKHGLKTGAYISKWD
jgi:hypothetical protein